jgi:N-acetylated-alpha-linked acidic dipeptidase
MRSTLIRSAVVIVTGLSALALTPAQSADTPLWGFTAEASRAQRELEGRFDAQIQPDSLRVWLKYLSRQPDHLGSPGDAENAEWIAAHYRAWGFQTRVDTFQVLFPTPKERVLELVFPNRQRMKLAEPAFKGDATSSITKGRLPPYNAYSADGDVTAEVVYVNYGVPADYEELARRGIDVKGKIVLARYGGSWRGIKPKVAAEHGAVGCLIYSDPRDDGYFNGDVYPKGSWRPDMGFQRGSVADMPQYPGDPLTPGVGATKDAKRLDRKDSPVIMKIPVLPISYGDAQPILASMEGPMAPPSWRGALPLPYHLGPGPAKVHLKLAFNWDLVPAHDVVATMPGSEYPDEWVIRGNHMDGWVFGAGDPLSGQVPLLEEARAVGILVKSGWRPKRTIVYTAWDGEEPGLLGSTEFAEDHAAELQKKAVAYINSDGNGRGFLGVGGSHQLERLVTQVAADVKDPETGVTALARLRARLAVGGATASMQHGDLEISPLGSGSDYTPFLQHLGIPSLNVGYGGEGGGGDYHSIIDSYDFYTRFGDPTFEYGVALAKTAGRLTLRLADADVLPFRYTSLAARVGTYLDQVEKLAGDMRTSTERLNKMVDDRLYALTDDPTDGYWVAPEKKAPVPYLNFAPLENSVSRLKKSAAAYDAAMAKKMAAGGPSDTDAQRLNALLQGFEQRLTSPDGLPRRTWFRHMIYAPGFWTGYGVKTLPGVREGIEQREWDNVSKYVGEISDALDRLSDGLDQATGMLGS